MGLVAMVEIIFHFGYARRCTRSSGGYKALVEYLKRRNAGSDLSSLRI